KPASITSTPSWASARATSSFSAEVSVAPGDCSPSRRVVSKIRTVFSSATFDTFMMAPLSAGTLRLFLMLSWSPPRMDFAAACIRGFVGAEHAACSAPMRPSLMAGARVSSLPRLDLHRLQEGHHLAQFRADLLDQVLLLLSAAGVEPGPPLLVLLDPLPGVRAILNLGEHLRHRALRLPRHDARAAGVVTVLGGVAHRVAHVVQPALVHQALDVL